MLLKIYLGISFLTLICMVLYIFSLENKISNKYGKQFAEKAKETTKKDIPGAILAWLKILITSFIPIFNVFILIIIIFFEKNIYEQTDEIVEKTLKEKERE
jgi:hypothetical protein